MKKEKRNSLSIIICYFGLYLAIGLPLLIMQPLGNPPDEYNRYLIPQYIARNGTLPNGYEESIRIGDYGTSYAFHPILPYIFQGYAMRFVQLFTDSPEALLYTARGVNLLLGLIMAWIVLLLSGQWFRDKGFGYCFAFLVTFLPQSIFVHTYVNTDSCCMLSIALMLYGVTLGLKSSFSLKSSLIMAAGIILCALSYYNAYGYILSCILLFTGSFLTVSDGNRRFDGKAFLKKGGLISALVLLGISWWFIRSAILYDGDFLGFRARNECAALYAQPDFHPDTRVTWQNQGHSLWDMLVDSDFLELSMLSFIGIYGTMSIITSIWVYRFYKALFAFGLALCVLFSFLNRKEKEAGMKHSAMQFFYHANMIFCLLTPIVLSIVYSYASDYQPQGRYILPSLIPLCYYTVRGWEKLTARITAAASRLHIHRCIPVFTAFALCAAIAGMVIATVYGYVLPSFEAIPVLP